MTLVAPSIARAPAPAAPPELRINGRRKLVPISFFSVAYGIDQKGAVQLIENQILWPCFNLGVSANGKRHICVWRKAIETFQPDRTTTQHPKLEQVIADVLPSLGLTRADKATIRGSELYFRWSISLKTFSDLLRAGELREVGKRASPCESPRIAWTSAAEFLKRRLL
jgi:hypothetical protein